MSSPEESNNTALSTWILYSVGFLGLGSLLFWSALTAYFSSDDFLHLSTVMKGGIPFMPTGTGRGFLRPVVGLDFWVEYRLWGTHPFGYHASNVLLHVLNSLLVVKLTTLLLPNTARNRTISLASGLIFLSMACHAESVSWISGRTDLIAALFSLLTLCSLVQGIRSGSRYYLFGSLFLLAAALFAKESAFALPFLMVATALFLRISRRWRIDLRAWYATLAGVAVILAIYFAVRHVTVGAFVGGYGAHGHLRFHQDLLAQAMSRFAWRAFLPPLPRDTSLFATHGRGIADLFSATLVAVTLLWTWVAWRYPKRRFGYFLYVAFWLGLLPVINMRIQWTNTEGERFLYLASIFAAMGAANLVGALSSKTWRRIALSAMIIVQGGMLLTATQRWKTAGECVKDIVAGIQSTHPEGTVLFANKPDSYNGAMIFRTGLTEAIRHFGPAPNEQVVVEVLYATTLFQSDHVFELRKENQSPETFTITAQDSSSVMVEEDRFDRIETLSGDERGYTFRLRAPLEHREILYYTYRGIQSLNASPPIADPKER